MKSTSTSTSNLVCAPPQSFTLPVVHPSQATHATDPPPLFLPLLFTFRLDGSAAAAAAEPTAGGNNRQERRLGLGLWGFGGGDGEKNAAQEVGAGTAAAVTAVREDSNGGQFMVPSKGSGGGGGRGGGGGGRFKGKGMKARGPRIESMPPPADEVDLTTDEDGKLWLPMNMSPPECSGSEEADGCESTVRFCLMHVGEYQESPWKYPMAAMLQKRSDCRLRENARAFRLSALRVRRDEIDSDNMRWGGRSDQSQIRSDQVKSGQQVRPIY